MNGIVATVWSTSWVCHKPISVRFVHQGRAECVVAHKVQALTGMDDEATIFFVDGVEAYDTISRDAIFHFLVNFANGDKLNFSSVSSTAAMFLWEDELGEAWRVVQGEGGEQGELFFNLGQHKALASVQAQLKEQKGFFFCFLDYMQIFCSLVVAILEKSLREKIVTKHPPRQDQIVEQGWQ